MMELATLTVNAGFHRRRWCPVTAQVPLDAGVDLASLTLRDAATRLPVAVQAWREEDGSARVAWIVADLPAGQARAYTLAAEGAPLVGSGVELRDEGSGRLAVYVGAEHLTTYNFGPDVVRPYLYPVLAGGGVGVTRNWPMVTELLSETTDHPHHKGIYTAQGDVNGVDNWSEAAGHGYQVHREFTRVYSGPVAGGFTQTLDWTDAERTPNMSETRRLTFYATPGHLRVLDYEIALHASAGPVTLGDTKEGGLLSVRVATSMDVLEDGTGGTFVNGHGGVQQGEAWGKRAPWCDYSGPAGGRTVGVAFLDHIDNPRFPTHWHVRNYGLMTANPMGLHDFTGIADNRWDLEIAAGETVAWRYRVIVHDGDATRAQIGDRYSDFAYPPTVTVS
ncbi:MAG: hypothetical protein GX657_12930 [Chloroflexi bacterium]|nr:hypothetical protein [Chloroflexota bacterium]